MSASWLRVLVLMIVSAWLAVGCSGPSKIDVGGTCALNSDCNQGLVCTWGKCHDGCHTTADCPAGQSCVTASEQSKVCQLPIETHCIYASDCQPPLACAVDQKCRNQCQKDVDCPTGQLCSTSKTCAEPKQVDSNKNLFPPDGGVSGSGGASGADATASCSTGAELCPCYPNDTCNPGLTCASHLCVSFGAGGGAGGTASIGGSKATGGTASTGGVTGTGGMGGAAGGTADGGGCPAGSETCACYGNGTCNGGLSCLSNLCVRPPTGGAAGAGGTLGAGGAVNMGGAAGGGGVSGTGGSIRTNPDASPDLPADVALATSGPDVGVGTGPDFGADTTGVARDTGGSAGSTGTNASLWNQTAVPTSFCDWDSNFAEIGANFWSDVDGSVVAVRFYKDPRNNSPHSGRLWTGAGVLLAEVPFAAETASGWQEAVFSAPVPIVAGARYVVSYHSTTGYSYDGWANVDNAPLHADASYYCYGDPPCFPSNVYGVNYWVDVVFSTALVAVPPDAGAKDVSSPDLAASSSADVPSAGSGSEAGVGTGPDSGADATGGAGGTGGSGGSTGTNASLWDQTAVPSSFCNWDLSNVEIGTGFWSDTPGNVVAVRFYKDPLNTGPHSGRVWTAAGALLAEVTFTAETASGWQEAPFAASVPVTASARYVVSFHSTTGYSYDNWSNVDRAPLHADAGYYCYGDPPCFPSIVISNNYWVDVVLSQ